MNKLAIGTVQFGMEYGIANLDGQVQQDEVENILNLAKQNGIRTLDTAQNYGVSEKSIGRYLSHFPNDSWDIVTKVGPESVSLLKSLEESEARLTVRPSALLAHSPELFLQERFQVQLQALRGEEFPINLGVSLYTKEEIDQVLQVGCTPEIVQLPLNMLDTRLYHCGWLQELCDRGIQIHARSVFLQGLFYLPSAELKHRFPDAYFAIEELKSIASEVNLELAELSLLWLMSRQEVARVVIGVDTVEQLEAHLHTLEKHVDPGVFEAALAVRYENEIVLNPSLWQ